MFVCFSVSFSFSFFFLSFLFFFSLDDVSLWYTRLGEQNQVDRNIFNIQYPSTYWDTGVSHWNFQV